MFSNVDSESEMGRERAILLRSLGLGQRDEQGLSCQAPVTSAPASFMLAPPCPRDLEFDFAPSQLHATTLTAPIMSNFQTQH